MIIESVKVKVVSSIEINDLIFHYKEHSLIGKR